MDATAELLSSSQAAERVGCHVRTIHRAAERGDLKPAITVPGWRGDLLFRPEDVDRFRQTRQDGAA